MQIEKNPLWRAGKHPLLWGCLLLTAITVLNNWPMAAFGFAWDDHGYVVKNYPIQDPVSLKSLLWCLTAFAEANWHPMTWLALHLQFQFFGLNPGGYHVTNLLLHIANTLLLYALLYRTTRAVGKSLFVAALFAVHPLHIESVAWISEIKDVLSTFFFLLMLHAYVSYARRPGLWRYGLVGTLLALGLASKPMLVTAPFVMLLLDYWPLGRWTGGPEAVLPDAAGPRYSARRLILEKLPFFAMVGVVCVLTFLAQREGGAVSSLSAMPMLLRMGNVVNSYIMYIWRMAWPWPLSFFYPYTSIPLWKFLLFFIGLLSISILALFKSKTMPYLLFGWLWYTGTLIPVIGIVQVGAQAMADRYTYIPSIGLFTAITWTLDDIRKRTQLSALLPSVLSLATILIFMCVSLDYLLKWINEEELYTHGLHIDKNNPISLNNYGIILFQKKDYDNAIKSFTQNIETNPSSSGARINLAGLYLTQKKPSKALEILTPALQANPNNGTIYLLLGQIFNSVHDIEIAERIFRKGLAFPQNTTQTAAVLADLLIRNGRFKEALDITKHYSQQVYEKDPQKAMLLWCEGRAQRALGETEKSRQAFLEALRLQPVFPNVRRELGRMALAENDLAQARAHLELTLRQFPWDPTAWALLGQTSLAQGRNSHAYAQFRRAFDPRYIDIEVDEKIISHLEFAKLLRFFGRPERAAEHVAEAEDLRKQSLPHPAFALRQLLFNTVISQ